MKNLSITITVCLLSLISLSAKESTKKLTLASYNIHHGASEKNKLNLDLTAKVLKKFDADIIALQEVDQFCKRSRNVDQSKYLAEKLGMHHIFGKAISLQGGAYGLAILSKYPILESKVHKLPSVGEARIALEVTVEPVKGKKATFVCIHFNHLSAKNRQDQITFLLKALEPVKLPTALIGDFNATPQTPSIAMFKKNWLMVPKKGSHLTHPAIKPTIEIDYFMLRHYPTKNLTCTVVDETKASDHRPIVMTLQFP